MTSSYMPMDRNNVIDVELFEKSHFGIADIIQAYEANHSKRSSTILEKLLLGKSIQTIY